MKTPISLIIDDPAPVISVYYEHAYRPFTEDGRPLVPTYSNELLFKFCDIIEKHGIKGKFSIVPMPGNKGDIVNGLKGVPTEDLNEWLNTVKARVLPRFTPCPEMLTHSNAVDLATGESLNMNEESFASAQTVETLTPYIKKALTLHKEAGIHSIGVTSPWNFGADNEEVYKASVSKAVYEVTGSKVAWYFLHVITKEKNVKPWIALEEDGRTLVTIPSTTRDAIWETISSTDTSDEYVSRVADSLITDDGKEGYIIRSIENGNHVVFHTHWQSLMSNGLGTGLRVLDEVCRRINKNLGDKVTWMSFEEIVDLVMANKDDYRNALV
ncbi:MAG: hypothetical protein IIX97_07780 [Clostridia bacterium]|nr:hypothetical protein [Clostridia bacterium]